MADMAVQPRHVQSVVVGSRQLIDGGGTDFGLGDSMLKILVSDITMRISTDVVQLIEDYGYRSDFLDSADHAGCKNQTDMGQCQLGTSTVHRPQFFN